MRGNLPADLRPVGDFLDNLLYSPGTDREMVVESEPRFQERPHPERHGDGAYLGLLAVRAAFSLYPNLALLPLDTLQTIPALRCPCSAWAPVLGFLPKPFTAPSQFTRRNPVSSFPAIA